MKRTGLFFTLAAFAGFALPGLADSLTLLPANISTSLDQCESQVCGGSNPALASYNGLLSSFPGPQTVGEGANVSAAGFPFPTLTSQVPTAGANALIAAELTYYFEVVPNDGDSNVTPVQIGVNAVGSSTVTTTSGAPGSNSANDVMQLAILSGESGTAVFFDSVSIVYNAGLNDMGQCHTSNTSSVKGSGVLNGVSPSCGTSSASGGFTEDGSYSISTNSLYEVAMIANLQVGTSNDGLAHGTGSVEAVSSIDPTIFVPAGYTLELSAGVGNGFTTSAVPEPSAWILLITVFGAIGFALRRRVNRSGQASAPAQ